MRAFFRLLLWIYPGEFRDEYGREMSMVFADRHRDAVNFGERLLILLEAVAGILFHAPKEHIHVMVRDLRYAVRLLYNNPLFAVAAILSLTIGIGANAAIFAVAKMVLFDALPVKDPQQLRILTWVNAGTEQPVPPVWGDVSGTKEGGLVSPSFSYAVLRELRKKTDVFKDLIAFKDVEMTVTTDGHPELMLAEMLSGDALRALGVRPILGRGLNREDDNGPAAAPVAVISEDYWAERFGRSPAVLGRFVSLNGAPVSIVGVTPARFSGLTMGSRARVFVPLTLQPLLAPRGQIIGNGGGSLLDNPQSWWVQILARLRADVPEAQTQAAFDIVLRRTAKATLPEAKNLEQFHLRLEPGYRGLDYLAGFARPSYILLALAGLVLLLACVNLANLLSARAESRQREMSTRLALGAGRVGIVRQLLTESLLLSTIGGMAGLTLGYLGRNVISALLAEDIRVDFDWGVLSFTIGLSLLTSLVFGCVPVWQAMRTDVNGALKDASRSSTGRHKVWFGKALVVLQVALSTVLLMGAGLFVRTLMNLEHTPLGFRTDHMLMFKLNPPRTRYTDQQMLALYAQLEEKLASIPGVRSVTLSNIGLIGDGHSGSSFHVSGSPVSRVEERVQANGVASGFFQTMGIAILQGRAFDSHDTAKSLKVAIVNRALVHRYFPKGDPIGQTFDSEDSDTPLQIVGVAADTKYADLRDETPPTFFVPYQQRDFAGRMMVEMRTMGEPFGVLRRARAAVEALDRDLPLIEVRTQEQQIAHTLGSERVFARLTSGFGLVALVLASIGVYGLMAYSVARRTGEIGIRMALGARVEQVLRAVMREALWLALAGLTLGLGMSLWLGRLVGSLLYGVTSSDPITMTVAVLVLFGITLLAGMGPARRAARVDPLTALRHE